MKKILNNEKNFTGKSIITLLAAILLCVWVAVPLAMSAEAVSSVDVSSAYVWRGQTFNDGMVIQPSIDVSAKNGLGFNVWGNYNYDDYNNSLDSHEFSEIDLTAYYNFTLSKVDLGIGVISYLFPAGAEETAEVYMSVGMNIVKGLSASLVGYYDIDAVDEFTYATLSLSYGYDITKELSVELGVSVGYAGDQFAKNAGGADGGLYDYTTTMSFEYACSDAWSISTGVTYVDAIDDDNLKEKSDGGLLDTNSYVSVGISYAF